MLKYFNDKCLQELIVACEIHRNIMSIADDMLRYKVQQDVDRYLQDQHDQGTIFYVHATKTGQLSMDTNDDIYRFDLKVYVEAGKIGFGVVLRDSITHTIFGDFS